MGVAFGLTLAAGLATGLGSAIAFFAKRTNLRLLSVATGFSAGVMLWVSFLEILPKSQAALTAAVGARQGAWLSVGSFFLGILLILAIDQLVPGDENPHEVRTALELASLGDAMALPAAAKLRRTGTAVAVAIAIHNFPEGMAT
ncbi:MAG: zinc transporter ZupT, partial [Thermoanaerobaculia bacterium]|nr:zinc transporter ZupT [Thermoanaerobaculia bacterium]